MLDHSHQLNQEIPLKPLMTAYLHKLYLFLLYIFIMKPYNHVNVKQSDDHQTIYHLIVYIMSSLQETPKETQNCLSNLLLRNTLQDIPLYGTNW